MKDEDSGGSIICRYDFAYNAMGNVTEEQSVDGLPYTLNNSYDAIYQLLQQKKLDANDILTEQYDYTIDPGGNITAEQRVYSPGTVMTYTYDNRLATFNGQAVVYDADGNMITGPLGGVMVNFNYDARNRLTSVGNVDYIYDAENSGSRYVKPSTEMFMKPAI